MDNCRVGTYLECTNAFRVPPDDFDLSLPTCFETT